MLRSSAAPLFAALIVSGGAAAQSAPPAVPPASTAAAAPAGPRFLVKSYRIEGENPLGPARAAAVLAPFTGDGVALEGLQSAAEALERALHEAGFGFYRVVLPPQDSVGEVRLRVLAFTVGEVSVKNQIFVSVANVRASLPALKEGTSPNTFVLARDLALANENPARRIVTAFRPGQKPDTVDASLEVTDSRPLTGFAQFANTGTPATGMGRITLGASHANLFGRDHQLTGTYTTSTEYPEKVDQWGAFYRAPVYGVGGMFSAYYTRSNVASGSAAGVAITGGGTFAGLQYTQYFAPRGDYRDYVTLGWDDKQFDNSVKVAGRAFGTCDRIASRPLTATYLGRYEGAAATLSFNIDWVQNLPGGSNNSQSAYDRCNPPADASRNLSADWMAWRFAAETIWRVHGDWSLSGRVRAQHAGQSLIAGEKFGAGGASSVRALPERALIGDTGHTASVEVWTPPLWEGLRVLGFYDQGRVRTREPAPGATAIESVGSVGFGLRWQYKAQLAVALDYGVVILGHAPSNAASAPQNTRGRDRMHVNLTLRF
ncbi:MAG: ShlB/FhaC/HecB family hemolysin secretion/activation protein [Burkholderiales bacterium]|nr:ShlB/FhaC/HecB family hemolysin secretion/activation protein [Burkholderiales bacterium]